MGVGCVGVYGVCGGVFVCLCVCVFVCCSYPTNVDIDDFQNSTEVSLFRGAFIHSFLFGNTQVTIYKDKNTVHIQR